MRNAKFALSQGLFADVEGDWRIHIVENDHRNAGVFYLGGYPYDADGRPLHPNAPAIMVTWSPLEPGARQISERQKRFAQYTQSVIFEPVFTLMHA